MTLQEIELFKTIILMLSAVDPLCMSHLFTGLAVISGPGGGKTSCVGKSLAVGLLHNVQTLGGLILSAKREEVQNWIRYFKLVGREADLIVFNAKNGLFDPIWYEWNHGGKSVEGIVELISTLGSLNSQKGADHDGPFWIRGVELLVRCSLILLDLAGMAVSLANIDRVIRSLPTHIGEADEEAWQKSSFCAQLVARIRDRKDSLTEDQWSDLEEAVRGVFEKWPSLDERPRSSLEMTWSGIASQFMFSPYKRTFCSGECSFTPEMTMFDHKFVLIDWPMLEVGRATGQFINVCLKLIFQRAWLRRNLAESPNPVLLWQDEFQYFVVQRWDNFFAETCRGSRVATVVMSQNILAISESLGEDTPGSKTKSLLGNFATKIFLQQNETDTNQYASDLIGREWKFIENFSGGDRGGTTAGAGLQLVHMVRPEEFARLTPPSAENPLAESICHLSGKTPNATRTSDRPEGVPYLRVFFSRE
jgi:hypothetical protein